MIKMRQFGKLALTLFAMILVTGCGEDDKPQPPSIAGVYQVASHTRSMNGCEQEGGPFDGDHYFKLSSADGGLDYQPCTAPATCTGRDASRRFDHVDGANWVGIHIDATEQRGSCEARLVERVAAPGIGESLRIEVRHYAGEFERADGQSCEDSQVKSHRSALGCEQLDIIKAVPVEEP